MAHLYDVFLSMKEVRGCVELEREKGEDVKSIIRTFERVEHLKCRSFYITGRFKIYQMPEITHTCGCSYGQWCRWGRGGGL